MFLITVNYIIKILTFYHVITQHWNFQRSVTILLKIYTSWEKCVTPRNTYLWTRSKDRGEKREVTKKPTHLKYSQSLYTKSLPLASVTSRSDLRTSLSVPFSFNQNYSEANSFRNVQRATETWKVCTQFLV